MNRTIVVLLFILPFSISGQVRIAQLKYEGGGDWYANPSSLKNLISFANQSINTNIEAQYDYVDINSDDIFNYPFVHMTGHGNVVFSQGQIDRLRSYLKNGGFLHIDDNYGMRDYILREIAKLFPDKKLEELGQNHPIFNMTFKFAKGLPKIHEHDNQAPKALGIAIEGRLVLLYTIECDLSDGWEDQKIHNDPDYLRLEALKMGANIIEYCFKN